VAHPWGDHGYHHRRGQITLAITHHRNVWEAFARCGVEEATASVLVDAIEDRYLGRRAHLDDLGMRDVSA